MKICFFVGNIYKIGGIQRVVIDIANSLSNNTKYKICIASLFKTDMQIPFKLNNNIDVIDIIEYECNIYKNYFNIYKNIKRKLNYDIDILITSPAVLSIFTIPIFKWKAKKIITWEHGSYDSCKKLSITNLGRIISIYLSNKYIVLTKQDFEIYKKLYKRKNIYHIYNPCKYLKSDINLNINKKKIITVGRIEHSKGIDLLIEVASKVLKNHSDWEWHIYGSGKESNNIYKLITDKGLENNIKLLGENNKIINEYSKYSLFVCTSRVEGFGLALIEAKQNNLPIVSFRCSGPSEIIRDGVDGYIIDKYNIEEMSRKIIKLIEDDSKRIEFSKEASKNLNKFDLDKITKKWEEILIN